jgi:hypothetical protein
MSSDEVIDPDDPKFFRLCPYHQLRENESNVPSSFKIKEQVMESVYSICDKESVHSDCCSHKKHIEESCAMCLLYNDWYEIIYCSKCSCLNPIYINSIIGNCYNCKEHLGLNPDLTREIKDMRNFNARRCNCGILLRPDQVVLEENEKSSNLTEGKPFLCRCGLLACKVEICRKCNLKYCHNCSVYCNCINKFGLCRSCHDDNFHKIPVKKYKDRVIASINFPKSVTQFKEMKLYRFLKFVREFLNAYIKEKNIKIIYFIIPFWSVSFMKKLCTGTKWKYIAFNPSTITKNKFKKNHSINSNICWQVKNSSIIFNFGDRNADIIFHKTLSFYVNHFNIRNFCNKVYVGKKFYPNKKI